MPKSAETIMEQLGIETSIEEQGLESLKTWGGIKSGGKIHPGLQLFPRIADEDAEKILNSVESTNDKGQKQSSSTEIEGICDQVLIDDFMKIDLRTGKIIEAEKIKKIKKTSQTKSRYRHGSTTSRSRDSRMLRTRSIDQSYYHFSCQPKTGKINGYRITRHATRR